MTSIFVSAVIHAPIEAVWAIVRDFNAMPQWHPRFSRSHIEDDLAWLEDLRAGLDDT